MPTVIDNSKETILAINQLSSCLQHWGGINSNPVIDLLDGQDLVINNKYPEPAISCQNGLLKIFYHYHNDPFHYEDEHGHFHFFIASPDSRSNDKQWSHIAGLSIDNNGQPTRWFTTNHWVTAGHWLQAPDLIAQLDNIRPAIEYNPELNLWLQSILLIFRTDINVLLKSRDQKLMQHCKAVQDDNQISTSDSNTVLQNRDIYILSEMTFDLLSYLSTLSTALSKP